MEYFETKSKAQTSRILIAAMIAITAFSSSLIWAGGRVDEEFFETYTLTEREMCELIASHSPFNERRWKVNNCDQQTKFKPLRSIRAPAYGEADMEQEISLSSSIGEDWPLADITIKTKSTAGLLTINKLSINDVGYNLSEYMPEEKHGYSAIHIGYSGEAILIRLEHQSITQLAIVPTYCKDKSVDFTASQVLSWYPPFQEDSYSKTFFTSPTCN